jgi:Flp pilus assembly protein TadD
MSADDLLDQGMQLADEQRFAEAIADIDQALQVDPTMARAWYCKGCMLGQLGWHAEAAQCYGSSQKICTK